MLITLVSLVSLAHLCIFVFSRPSEDDSPPNRVVLTGAAARGQDAQKPGISMFRPLLASGKGSAPGSMAAESTEEDAWMQNTNTIAPDIHDYSPHPRVMNRFECGTLCEAAPGCKMAVWNCAGRCYLKWDTGTLADAECSFSYRRGSYERYRVIPALVEDLPFALKPVDGGASPVHVVISACQWEMQWFKRLLESLHITFGSLPHVIHYDTGGCRSSPLDHGGNATVQHVTTPDALRPYMNADLLIVAHLLANLASYSDGSTTHTIFVNPEIQEKSGSNPPSIRWTFGEFLDHVTNAAQTISLGTGLHLVDMRHVADVNDAMVRLESHGERVLKSGVHQIHDSVWRSQCELGPATSVVEGRAIVTYVGDGESMLAARVLIHSLQMVGSEVEVVVATNAQAEAYALSIAEEFGSRVVVWSQIESPFRDLAKAHEDSFTKLNIFNMTEYGEILYIHPDVIALHDPQQIFDYKAIQESSSHFFAAPDWGTWEKPPSSKLNTGVLFVRPSAELFHCMLHEIRATDKWDVLQGDKGFLRYFFGDRSVQLPYFFNTQTSIAWNIPELWDEERVVLLRYVGGVPSSSWSPTEWLREWRTGDERQRMAKKQWFEDKRPDWLDDERDEYGHVVTFWRKVLFSLANLQKQMTIFAAYHDALSYSWVQSTCLKGGDSLVQPLSMRDVAAGGSSTVAPAHFRVFLTVAKATWYQKPWVGFTTFYEEAQSLEREGVSVDWVKVESALAKSNKHTVLFWFGQYAGDYWEHMEHFHPGMRLVLRRLLARMGHPVDLMEMPSNRFWPFGSYVIMPTVTLRKFSNFTTHFVKAFEQVFAGETCPFEAEETLRARDTDKCIGYLVERLLHIWSILDNVDLTYVVDKVRLRYESGCRAHSLSCMT